MPPGCVKDKITEMTEKKQIRQGQHIPMINSLLHLAFRTSEDNDSQSNSEM